jgi:hypothetical protein
VHDEVDDEKLNGGHDHEDDEDFEHWSVIAEAGGAWRNPRPTEQEPVDALVAMDF